MVLEGRDRIGGRIETVLLPAVAVAVGQYVIKFPSPLNVPKDTYDRICY